jgi:hypothetical protein
MSALAGANEVRRLRTSSSFSSCAAAFARRRLLRDFCAAVPVTISSRHEREEAGFF